LATAHGESLLVVDLRGPRILLRFGHEPKSKNKEKLTLRLKHHSELSDPIEALTWTVTTLGAGMPSLARLLRKLTPRFVESQLRVLLIAVHASGLTEVFRVNRSSGSGSWVIDGECTKTHTVQHPIPGGTFVVDSKTGVKRNADGARLKLALQSSPTTLDAHGILIVTGANGAKCIRNVTGERLGKTDWGNKMGIVRSAEVVGTMGASSVVNVVSVLPTGFDRLACSCCHYGQT
jgi:syntaxin-binding protein 5